MEKEKVLRKVSVKDRLPKIDGDYDTDVGTLCFVKDRFYNNLDGQREYPEYWYEEVSVEELISYTDTIIVKRVIEIHNKLAKGRYEKAKYLLNTNQGLGTTELIDKCLKIAAGLENEV